jgi:hypothetical protein
MRMRPVCLLAVGFLFAASLEAQATRTWVSGVGDDVNPCSRTAPCKTFAGAISKTAANGEINVLDPGAYGAVTITKSIIIRNEGGFTAGVLATLGSSGIIVNDTTGNAVVELHGLDIHGAASGASGIRFLAGKSLVVEDCAIRNFSTGKGIDFVPSVLGGERQRGAAVRAQHGNQRHAGQPRRRRHPRQAGGRHCGPRRARQRAHGARPSRSARGGRGDRDGP